MTNSKNKKFPLPPEYWQIQCPHCMTINYYRLLNPVEECFLDYRKWPILKCKCKKYYSKIESEMCVLTVCEKIKEPSNLQIRQSDSVELEVKSK